MERARDDRPGSLVSAGLSLMHPGTVRGGDLHRSKSIIHCWSWPHVFAFWLSPQGELFASKARKLNFGHFLVIMRGLITSGAASFAAAVDAFGEWHLAYVRTVDDPNASGWHLLYALQK